MLANQLSVSQCISSINIDRATPAVCSMFISATILSRPTSYSSKTLLATLYMHCAGWMPVSCCNMHVDADIECTHEVSHRRVGKLCSAGLSVQ
jgi:hypothetical protein